MEVLDDRTLLSIYGIPWPDPGHLTVSFVPDGTDVGGVKSDLFSSLNADMPTARWEDDVLAGIQAWASVGNINVGVVPDDGRPLGAAGPEQGVPGVGDIRIAARPLSNNILAESSPYDALGGWSGTMILNSDAVFGDGPTAAENLPTVATHEAGHVFGFPDEHNDPTSAMYDVDTGPTPGLSASDVAALQSLYGARTPDANDSGAGNGTPASATPIAVNAPSAVVGDITTNSDKDVYSFSLPLGCSGGFTVTAQASGVSLLTPKVSVYTVLGIPVASASTTDPMNNTVSVSIPFALPLIPYYVQVEGSQANGFGIGGYKLAVGSATQVQAALSASSPLTYATGHANSQFSTATLLSPATPGTDARWPYTVTSGLMESGDADYYKIATGATAPTNTLLTVRSLQAGGLTPAVAVFDANHNPLPTQVLNSGPGGETVQVSGVSANSTLYVEVSAASSSVSTAGNYFLGLTFNAPVIADPTIASATLSGSSNVDFRTMTVTASSLFHFDLSGTAAASSDPSAVLMTIFSSAGVAVFNLRAVANAGLSEGDVLLDPGTYTIRVIAATKSGATLPPFSYTLGGQTRNDPSGPNPGDPTMNPSGPNPSGPPSNPGSYSNKGTPYYYGTMDPSQINGQPWS